MKYPDLGSFNPDDCEEIHPNVWLMDDHKWAYYAWEKWLTRYRAKVPTVLLHLDYHWDGINDFRTDFDQDKLYRITSIEEIYLKVKEGRLIKYDSFIAPAIIRGIINEVHFLCFQNDEPPGLDEEFLNRFKVKQVIHEDLQSLVRHAPNGSLVDIDLDIFNRSDIYDTGELWAETEIMKFLDACSKFIKYSPLITIAMSFGHSGSSKDTKYLTRLVVSKIIEFRREEIVTVLFPIRY